MIHTFSFEVSILLKVALSIFAQTVLFYTNLMYMFNCVSSALQLPFKTHATCMSYYKVCFESKLAQMRDVFNKIQITAAAQHFYKCNRIILVNFWNKMRHIN